MYSYWRTERLILDAVDRRILQKTNAWHQIASIFPNADVVVVVLAICMLGLLTSLVVFLALPAFAEMFEVLQRL